MHFKKEDSYIYPLTPNLTQPYLLGPRKHGPHLTSQKPGVQRLVSSLASSLDDIKVRRCPFKHTTIPMSPYRPCHQQLQAPNWMGGQSTEWSAEYSYVCFVDITVHSWYSWYSNLDQVFYLSAETDMKREIERKEQERKKSPKVEFIPGGVQPSIGASMPKIPGIMNMKQLHLMFWQIIITCPHKYLFDNIDVCYILSFSWCCDTSGTRRRCKKGD